MRPTALALTMLLAAPSLALSPSLPPQVSRSVNVATDVVILVNDNVPESIEIGAYYAQKRGIPPSQICHVLTKASVNLGYASTAGAVAEIIDWPEATATIFDPLRTFLASRPGVLYIVPTYGIPLKLWSSSDTGYDYAHWGSASLDSELAALKISHSLAGGWTSPVSLKESHITLSDNFYIVSRLDGPDADDAFRLVDNAMTADANGVQGSCLLDTGNTSNTTPAYDLRMSAIADLWSQYGLANVHETTSQIVGVSGRSNQSHYYGLTWSDQGWMNDAWRFKVGAVGFTNGLVHANEAYVIHGAPDFFWAGPLIHHGITGTCGGVGDVHTAIAGTTSGEDAYTKADIFFARFLAGFSFGESMAMATPFVSSQQVFFGDPLYAPYAANVAGSGHSNEGLTGSLGNGDGGGSGGGEDGTSHPPTRVCSASTGVPPGVLLLAIAALFSCVSRSLFKIRRSA